MNERVGQKSRAGVGPWGMRLFAALGWGAKKYNVTRLPCPGCLIQATCKAPGSDEALALLGAISDVGLRAAGFQASSLVAWASACAYSLKGSGSVCSALRNGTALCTPDTS